MYIDPQSPHTNTHDLRQAPTSSFHIISGLTFTIILLLDTRHAMQLRKYIAKQLRDGGSAGSDYEDFPSSGTWRRVVC
jgi:hypothetical protein